MSRRFVHLVLCNAVAGRGGFTLHSISTANLFNPSTWTPPNGCAGGNTTMEVSELPSPSLSLYRPSMGYNMSWMEFMRLGQISNSKFATDYIIGTDHEGHTILYDAASGALQTMPNLHSPKYFPVSLAIGGHSLYVMNSNPLYANCFEALIQGPPPDGVGIKDWYWHSLPTPPYAHEPTAFSDPTSPDYDEHNYEDPHSIRAYTVVGESSLWYSTVGAGTYCFETSSSVWNKVGDWVLPFCGYVCYVPEHGLWFGLSSNDDEHNLCASNLVKAAKDKPPVVLKSWQYLTSQDDWIPYRSYLVPLGSTKFCIVNIFAVPFERDERFVDSTFGVFTGVEVLTNGAGGLKMIPHKSIRYNLDQKAVNAVL